VDRARGGGCCQAPLLGLIPFFLLYSFRKHVMSQLQMRSLHTRSITQPPFWGSRLIRMASERSGRAICRSPWLLVV